MTDWLQAIHADPRGALIARGYAAAFELLLRAAELGDIARLEAYDEEWSRTLPRDDGRIDDLEQLRAAVHLRSQGDRDDGRAPAAAADNLRLLRAVYRFGVLAWLMRAREGGRSPERAAALRVLAEHFRDSSALAFVAGEALAVSGDRRMAWWSRLLVPKHGRRVVATSFDPTLQRAFVTLLMDAVEQGTAGETPPEPWIESALPRLLEALDDAWPLMTDPSWWDGVDDEAVVRSRALARGILWRLAERAADERVQRVAALPLLPERRARLTTEMRETWARRRGAGAVLLALGSSEQHVETLPPGLEVAGKLARSPLVGEASERVLASYAHRLGRALEREEDARARALLADLPLWPGAGSPERGVHDAIAQLRGQGMAADLVLVNPRAEGLRGLGLEPEDPAREVSLPDLVSDWRLLLGRVDDVPVVASRTVERDRLVVLCARRALARACTAAEEEPIDVPRVELREAARGDAIGPEVVVVVRVPFRLLLVDPAAGWWVNIGADDA